MVGLSFRPGRGYWAADGFRDAHFDEELIGFDRVTP
jgi:hypothetical protein